MTPKQYLTSRTRKSVEEMAGKAGSSYAYFTQVASGHRSPSIKKAKAFMAASDRIMKMTELIPELADVVVDK